MTNREAAPVLLFLGDYYGTLSVARALGKRGISVSVADASPFTRTGCSRFVSRRLSCPSLDDPERFLEWVFAFGEREPGHVIFPASDALAWLFAKYERDLARNFRLYAPPLATVMATLDKKRLHDACTEVGIAVPRTACPSSGSELDAVADSLAYPVLLKPRTQILLASGSKGGLVRSAAELRPAVNAYLAENTFGEALLASDPTIAWPMIQEFFVGAERGIYGLSGFLDRSGAEYAVRGARKVLQRPRRLGIGLCFESAPVELALAARVRALLLSLGYFGIFEVELVEYRGTLHLIDFNPRPYSQMAFDEARGLPLAALHYLGAVGDTAGLHETMRAVPSSGDRDDAVYHHRLLLDLVRAGQRAVMWAGGPSEEPWGNWLEAHRGRDTDAVRERGDMRPALADALKQAVQAAKHPRSFVRSLMR